MADRDIRGEARLCGTPAEETVVGKVYMANAGVFDDVDATLVWQPMTETRVTNASTRHGDDGRGPAHRPRPARGRV